MEDLSAYALHAESQHEYRELVLDKVIEQLGLAAGLLWHSDGVSSSITRPSGMNDGLGNDRKGHCRSPTRVASASLLPGFIDKNLSPNDAITMAKRSANSPVAPERSALHCRSAGSAI
ncbi:MAG TPA: hypothetical protein VHC69_25790 [Polyangiaceae bacterium]|nr:hypothetical protein [Polyangiaceae bacterium]